MVADSFCNPSISDRVHETQWSDSDTTYRRDVARLFAFHLTKRFVMPIRFTLSLLVVAGALAGQVCGQSPAPTSDAADPNPLAASSASAVRATFPPKPEKKLYAKTDLRGQKAPQFKPEAWLTPAAAPAAPDTTGKVTLIDFWATWCGPCRRLIPELNAWQKEFKDDLVVIGVSDESADKVRGFMKSTTVEYSMAVDSRKNAPDNIVTMHGQIGVQGVPHVLVIDSTGIVRWQGFPQGQDPLTIDVLKTIIAADKAQRPGKVTTTPATSGTAAASPAPGEEKKASAPAGLPR